MKKLLLVISLLYAVTTGYAQASYGTYTMFPNKKLYGSAWKPQLAFGKVNDQFLLVLRTSNPSAYSSFDENSVLLLKFSDDSVVKLPLSKSDKVETKYNTEWNSLLKSYTHYYITYASFDIDDAIKDRIVKNNDIIKKVRVSYTNGDIQDWDIDDKYQPKLTKGLCESYAKVESSDATRKNNIGDVESGF